MRNSLWFLLVPLFLAKSLFAGDVYAKINGEILDKSDLAPMLKMFGKEGDFNALNTHEKKMVLDQSIERKLILQSAKKENIPQDPNFQKIVEDFKKRLLVEFWMRKRLDAVKVEDRDIKSYFEKHREEFAKEAKLEDFRDQLVQKVKMEKFQILVDEELSKMKKAAKIEFLGDVKVEYK